MSFYFCAEPGTILRAKEQTGPWKSHRDDVYPLIEVNRYLSAPRVWQAGQWSAPVFQGRGISEQTSPFVSRAAGRARRSSGFLELAPVADLLAIANEANSKASWNLAEATAELMSFRRYLFCFSSAACLGLSILPCGKDPNRNANEWPEKQASAPLIACRVD